MDIEKLIEQLNGYFEGKDLKRFVALDAATALSTLQEENEKLRAELENYRKGHCSEGGCAAEKDRDAVLAELEQVKREMRRLEIWKWCLSAIRVCTSTPRPALGAMTLKTGNGAARRRGEHGETDILV